MHESREHGGTEGSRAKTESSVCVCVVRENTRTVVAQNAVMKQSDSLHDALEELLI